jgi:hypothetical protein
LRDRACGRLIVLAAGTVRRFSRGTTTGMRAAKL